MHVYSQAWRAKHPFTTSLQSDSTYPDLTVQPLTVGSLDNHIVGVAVEVLQLKICMHV